MFVKVRCANDHKRMFDIDADASKKSVIKIKCPHCKIVNNVYIKDGKYIAKCDNEVELESKA